MRAGLACACALALAGCTAVPPAAPAPGPTPAAATSQLPPPPPERPGAMRLACEGGGSVSVRLLGDEAHLTGLGGDPQVLLRDAGGVTPQQSVFSNPDWRAEFGLGTDGRGAVLHQLQPLQRTLNCRRG